MPTIQLMTLPTCKWGENYTEVFAILQYKLLDSKVVDILSVCVQYNKIINNNTKHIKFSQEAVEKSKYSQAAHSCVIYISLF